MSTTTVFRLAVLLLSVLGCSGPVASELAQDPMEVSADGSAAPPSPAASATRPPPSASSPAMPATVAVTPPPSNEAAGDVQSDPTDAEVGAGQASAGQVNANDTANNLADAPGEPAAQSDTSGAPASGSTAAMVQIPNTQPPLPSDEAPVQSTPAAEPSAEPAPVGLDGGGAEETSETATPDTEQPLPSVNFVGNITTGNNIDPDGFTFSNHWDQITPENAGKWGSVQPNPGGNYNWSALDAIYDYAEANGIIFKQHTFVWGNQQPGGNIGENDVKSWMRAFCERYPNTALIDVVNEPPPHTTPAYADSIGGGTNGSWQWITNSFIWAREACPNAVLLLNDFNNIEWPNDNQHFVSIVKTIMEAGAPIDAIGAQAHDLDNPAVSFDRVKGLLQTLHDETGLPVYITEYDISTTDDNAQLDAYRQHVTYFRELDYVPGITIWGWIYGRTWSAAPNSGLIRDGNPRPAMTWLMSELGRPTP